MITTIAQKTYPLTDRHIKEAATDRGLDLKWIEANCRSGNEREIGGALGRKSAAPSGGLILTSWNGQVQVRPDTPWGGTPDKAAPKYRTPIDDEYDVLLAHIPDDENFWTKLLAGDATTIDKLYKIDGKPYLILAEGLFKAIALCQHGHFAIGLIGVEMGLTGKAKDPEGKRFLVPSLRKLAELGIGFIICFDADIVSNLAVAKAQKTLAQALDKFNPTYILSGYWNKEEGKGVDDYIKQNSIEKFRQNILGKEQRIAIWEKQFSRESEGGGKDSGKTNKQKADAGLDSIIERYRNNLVFCAELNSWMLYDAQFIQQKGIWTPITVDYVTNVIIYQEFKAYKIPDYRREFIQKWVYESLKSEVFLAKWEIMDSLRYVPFENGVLDLTTNKLEEHKPGYHHTWIIPRKYDPLQTDYPAIDNFLNHLCMVSGTILDEGTKHLLLCFLNAAIKGRSELQVFLNLIGNGGNGKGTFLQLAEILLGATNCYSSLDANEFIASKFELANIRSKRLLYFPDQQTIIKNPSKLFAISGSDALTAEVKYKQPENFKFYGLMIISSNKPIFVSESSSALKRRQISIACGNTIATDKRKPNLVKDFAAEMAAFTNVVLAISDEEVEKVLKNHTTNPSVAATSWESKIRNDSLAAFIDAYLIAAPDNKERVGNGKTSNSTNPTLYAAYCTFCHENNLQPRSSSKFSPDLLDLANSYLAWNLIKGRDELGAFIKGCRMKTNPDAATIADELLKIKVEHLEGLTIKSPSPLTPPEEPKTPPNKDSDDLTEKTLILNGWRDGKIYQAGTKIQVAAPANNPFLGKSGELEEDIIATPGADIKVVIDTEITEIGRVTVAPKAYTHCLIEELDLITPKSVETLIPKNQSAIATGQRVFIEGWIPAHVKALLQNGKLLLTLDNQIPDSTKDKIISWGSKQLGANGIGATREAVARRSWETSTISLVDKKIM